MSEWQPIPSCPGYEVSRFGSVRCSEFELGQWKNSHGYPVVRLRNPRKVALVHRLVAEVFVPNPEDKPFVNHIDCVRSNNIYSNLEWCTQAENLRHSDNMGRMQRDYWVGKRSPAAKLSDETAEAIRRAYAKGGVSMSSLAMLFGTSKRTVLRIVHMESYMPLPGPTGATP